VKVEAVKSEKKIVEPEDFYEEFLKQGLNEEELSLGSIDKLYECKDLDPISESDSENRKS
jgi:hypothetical protein